MSDVLTVDDSPPAIESVDDRVYDFFENARERQSIYRKRERGEPSPWTDDLVMRRIYLTNVFREEDKTTVWFRENVRDHHKDDPFRAFAFTILFRWFNRIETGEFLFGGKRPLAEEWFARVSDSNESAESIAEWMAAEIETHMQPPYFTGAFMIKLENATPKHLSVAKAASRVLKGYLEYSNHVGTPFLFPTLQGWTEWLKQFNGLGGFMAYEVVSDFRWTCLAQNSSDIMTWANIGPGCARGLSRIYYGWHRGAEAFSKDPKQSLEIMRWLLWHTSSPDFWPQDERPWEMREVEHWLCEHDKICRARAGDGRIKRKYPQ